MAKVLTEDIIPVLKSKIPKLYGGFGKNSDGAMTQSFIDSLFNSDNVAIGKAAGADGDYSVAIGGETEVTDRTTQAVALGYGSMADESNTVSVGNSMTELTRRITNLSPGSSMSDAVNVSQMVSYVGGKTPYAWYMNFGAQIDILTPDKAESILPQLIRDARPLPTAKQLYLFVYGLSFNIDHSAEVPSTHGAYTGTVSLSDDGSNSGGDRTFWFNNGEDARSFHETWAIISKLSLSDLSLKVSSQMAGGKINGAWLIAMPLE